MHPILTNGRWLAGYFSVWIPLGAILGIAANLAGRWSVAAAIAWTVPVALLLAVVCLAPYYVCRTLPLRSSAWTKLAFNHLVPAIGISGAVTVAGRMLTSGLAATFPEFGAGLGPSAPVLQAMFAMLYLLSVALHYAWLEMQASRKAEVLAREAQLRALKAQVNPHFLFNSLNSISALTAVDAEQAREMCIRLADFLRVSLRLGERTNVPFREELDLTQMYLNVEKVRFGERLRIRVDVAKACLGAEVPPLIIQPLVENAVKHGVAMMAEGGEITMEGRLKNGQLWFRIGNPFDPESPSTGRNGLGLRNIRERLASRYGNGARMEILARQDWYEVTVTIPTGRAGSGEMA